MEAWFLFAVWEPLNGHIGADCRKSSITKQTLGFFVLLNFCQETDLMERKFLYFLNILKVCVQFAFVWYLLI